MLPVIFLPLGALSVTPTNAGATPSLAMVVSASQTILPSLGGSVTVTVNVKHASKCELRSLEWEGPPLVRSVACAGNATSNLVSIPISPNQQGNPFRSEIELSAVSGSEHISRELKFVTDAAPPFSSPERDPSAQAASGESDSFNWSGYVLAGGQTTITHLGVTFYGIVAQWRVPSVRCSASPASQSAEWVGVDGFDSSDQPIFQTGTSQLCVSGGLRSDFAWWTNNQRGFNPQALFEVDSGDLIRAEVERAGSHVWDYFLEDLTSGRSAQGPEAYRGPGYSAEWIVEDPNGGSGPLADFSAVTFDRLGVLDSAGSWSDPPPGDAENTKSSAGVNESDTGSFTGVGSSASFTVDYTG